MTVDYESTTCLAPECVTSARKRAAGIRWGARWKFAVLEVEEQRRRIRIDA